MAGIVHLRPAAAILMSQAACTVQATTIQTAMEIYKVGVHLLKIALILLCMKGYITMQAVRMVSTVRLVIMAPQVRNIMVVTNTESAVTAARRQVFLHTFMD